MKKTLLTLTLAGATAYGAMAQGTVTFQASGATRPIQFTTDNVTLTKVATGSPAQIPGYGNLNIAVYSAPNGTVLSLINGVPDFSVGGWAIGTPIMQAITAIPGNISGTTTTMGNGTAGNPVEFEVVGWTGTATTFAQAVGAAGPTLLGFTGSVKSGGALGWSQATGTATTAAVMNTGAGGFNGLVLQAVPEPSTIALGGLGAAALLLFRRRK